MKSLCFLVFLFSCTRTIDPESYDLIKIEKEARQILLENQGFSSRIVLSGAEEILKLKPERGYVTKNGLYIVLSSFFASAEGIFIPRESFNVDTSPGNDPSYERVKGDVYLFKIRG